MIPKYRRPTHPGEIIKEMYLKPLGVTQNKFAKTLGISRPRANELINGWRSVTPDTAIRLAKAFKTSPEYWLNMQASVDLFDAQRRHRYKNIRPLLAA
ncbi:MAG: HigA family addiction module antidote protein [Deltaproteobacteria bacterium]|nr:HigA family addiction module antidote protein [Deltaproteobacteria bacterium]